MANKPSPMPMTVPKGTKFLYGDDTWTAQETMRLNEDRDFYHGLVTCDGGEETDNRADCDRVIWDSLPSQESNKDACNCHQAKALQSELTAFRVLAFNATAAHELLSMLSDMDVDDGVCRDALRAAKHVVSELAKLHKVAP